MLTILIIMSCILLLFFSAQTMIILNNNNAMKDINIALRSNVDAVIAESNIRGFSASIQNYMFENDSAFELQNKYVIFDNSIEEFRKIISKIENGESKRPRSEISSELSIHKKTLSDAQILSDAIKDYLSGKTIKPADALFDTVFESATLSLKHDSEDILNLKDADDTLLRYVTNTTFLLIILEAIILFTLIFITYSNVINPVRNLTKTILDISLGKFNTEIEGKKLKNEIGDLARAFERTAVSLKVVMKKIKPVQTKEVENTQKDKD